MKLLFVHERFGSLGGAEANALITATELKARGHEVAILHGPNTGKGEARWTDVFDSRFQLSSARAAQQALRRFSPDVIYVHKMADLAVLEVLIDSGIPLVRMVHDHDIYCMRSYKYFHHSREICTRACSAYCVYGCGAFIARNHGPGLPVKYVSYPAKKKEIALNQKFDRMLVVSEFMRQELLRNGFDPNKIEIHPPVPRAGDLNLRSSFTERNLIIYAGQIIRGKGVDVLLESLALMETKFECIILGDGNHRPYCEQLSRKLGLQDRVSFKGFVPQEELTSYYRECTAVAVSSVWPEPIATIGLEVMRYALPVVAFDAGGISDWLKNGYNGYLVPWMDRKAFARSLDTLLRDKQLARTMGQNGYQFVSEKYDFTAYISGLEALFQGLLGDPASARTSTVCAVA